ncbi:helix-turn-helix domain-containing protein [Pedococcus sp. 2YAF34]|uniref:helix-turn-helix domain-containing protein n=1 Tax=Pedococcus sp. 2YAF34 TaxID=3233032 RepID=UPI003F9B0681
MSRIPLGPLGGESLGDYLREQRQTARLSLRQLSELAGVSNPYLSQIERGLKKPSAEILQQLAKGLEVSAESLYVRAGILDERQGHQAEAPDTRAVIGADPRLNARQKSALLDIYDSFVGGDAAPRSTRTRKAASGTTRKPTTRAAKTSTTRTEGE